jgi:lipoprotein-releasing system ATP-binding protein
MSEAAPETRADALIRIEGLTKRFEIGDASIDVLKGIDLTLDEGDRVAIVGQSGVGKSTFLHILGTLDHPTSGRLLFEGDDVFARSSAELAKLRNRFLGFVFQFHHLLPEFSAVENVMMPGLIQELPSADMRERAAKILDEVGLAHRLDHAVGKLSGGERQRVAVARALVLEPKVVLADEPTGNLDPSTGDQVAELLFEMNRRHRTTLVVVTHSARMAEQLGRTLVMVDGRFIEGDPSTAVAGEAGTRSREPKSI